MTGRSLLRASDADREHVAERLRQATAEGRLLAEELEERLGVVFASRTYGELDSVLADLPAERPSRRSDAPLWVKAAFAAAVAMAVIAVAALVTLILLGLAGAWLAWLLLMWALMGRGGRGCRRGHSGNRAKAIRNSRARAGVPGGRAASLL